MKKLGIYVAIAALMLSSCEGNVIPEPAPQIQRKIVVLNNGSASLNDASISIYDSEEDMVTTDLFNIANGRNLGMLAQDMIIVGEDVYITVNNSQIIFITDKNFKIKDEIRGTADQPALSPRYLAACSNYVYVTFYEGYLGEIDTETHEMRITPVGSYPEGLCIAGGKAYVANSGFGYDNTVSVVNLASFNEETKITVSSNPQFIVADMGPENIYVCCWEVWDQDANGNWYVSSPGKLQKVSLKDYSVEDLSIPDVKVIVDGGNNHMYYIQGQTDENFYVTSSIHRMNLDDLSCSEALNKEPIENFYSVSMHKGFIFVGTSNYMDNGDMTVYDSLGNILYHFDTKGLNPQKGFIF